MFYLISRRDYPCGLNLLNFRLCVNMYKTLKGDFMKIFKELKIKNFIMLLFAGIINAFGVTFFLQPVRLYDSGISGTSMLLSQVTPDWMSLSVFLVVLNIPIFLFGAKKQGLAFTVYSLFTVGIYSLSAWIITDVLPVDVSTLSPFAKDDLF